MLHRSLGEKIARADGYTEMGELKGGKGEGLGCDDVDGSDAFWGYKIKLSNVNCKFRGIDFAVFYTAPWFLWSPHSPHKVLMDSMGTPPKIHRFHERSMEL